MTTTFDALARLVLAYRDKMQEEDYRILQEFVQTIHDLQHAENNHRIDSLIERKLQGVLEKRFQEWRYGSPKKV